jgi:hypothetical protein
VYDKDIKLITVYRLHRFLDTTNCVNTTLQKGRIKKMGAPFFSGHTFLSKNYQADFGIIQ